VLCMPCHVLQVNGQCMASRSASVVGWPGPAYGEAAASGYNLALQSADPTLQAHVFCRAQDIAAQDVLAPFMRRVNVDMCRSASAPGFCSMCRRRCGPCMVAVRAAAVQPLSAATWDPGLLLPAATGGPCDQFGAYCRMWEVVDFAELDNGGCLGCQMSQYLDT
jgi:hypothetical protein